MEYQSIWNHHEDKDTIFVTKRKNSWYGQGNKFDFERDTKKELEDQLKAWGYEKIEFGK